VKLRDLRYLTSLRERGSSVFGFEVSHELKGEKDISWARQFASISLGERRPANLLEKRLALSIV
jgi:hypothetical protein